MAEDIEKIARRWALENAQKHEGNASPRAVIGKIFAERSDLKSKVNEVKRFVGEVVKEVNQLSYEEQGIKLEELGPPERLEVERERGLPELPELERYDTVITRFAPNPNGPLHLGHARSALLCHEYARRHGGKFWLRFEDTNPKNAISEIYDLIIKDLKWLRIDWDDVYYQSDRLETYYKFAERLLAESDAYVCTCNPPKFRKHRDGGVPCPCRELDSKKHLERWQGMLEGQVGEGDAVVRIKTDLDHPNPALRDWPALRVSTAPHPRTGRRYRVWPLYNFSVSVDDYDMGITHVIRGKEHEVNELRQKQLFDLFGWDYPTAIHHGRISISGAVLSKTRIMRGIAERKFEGYDDVKLATIAALRRRGFAPDGLRRVILDIGITKVDSTLSWDTIIVKNRRIIDNRANRYFFVPDPVKLKVENVPEVGEVRLNLHPDYPERGRRTLPLLKEKGPLTVWIAREDLSKMEKGKTVRLKDFLNFVLTSRKPPRGSFDSFEVADIPKIQWVSANPIKVKVLRPDSTHDLGFAEPEVKALSVGEVIQFERYGFIRVERIKPEIVAVFAHR